MYRKRESTGNTCRSAVYSLSNKLLVDDETGSLCTEKLSVSTTLETRAIWSYILIHIHLKIKVRRVMRWYTSVPLRYGYTHSW